MRAPVFGEPVRNPKPTTGRSEHESQPRSLRKKRELPGRNDGAAGRCVRRDAGTSLAAAAATTTASAAHAASDRRDRLCARTARASRRWWRSLRLGVSVSPTLSSLCLLCPGD
ncbi:hypothetical protein MRX96_017943 [Rhipicephalus microplus]